MYKKCSRLALATAIVTAPVFTLAASFQLMEQSPAQLGKAFAGTASDPVDATIVFFNPAAMADLDRPAMTAGLDVTVTDADFSNEGSTWPGFEDGTREYGLLSNLYAVMPLTELFALGFGVTAPFGLESNYEDEWVGRYAATRSDLLVTNFNITGAWALTDKLSLGLGLNYQRTDVTLEKQVDSTLGVAPDPATDSSVKIEGDDDDIVLDASVFFKPAEGTRLGILWRQGGDFTLSGNAEFVVNAACTPGAGFPTGAPPAPTTGTLCAGALGPREGNIKAEVELPDTITLSLSQQLNDAWTVHADIARTRWSSIHNIEVVNITTGVIVDTLDLQYDDTMRYALGITLATESPWTWRAGIAFDEAPQTDAEHATPRIPDEDRAWLSIGVNWALSDNLSIDMSYAHLFFDEASITDVDETSGRRLSGSFDNSVDILGAQVNWRF
jgi:long-chain fatty acid transport protein